MDTITTKQKIERLKQELAELEEQERAEKEEARKRAAADKDKELTAIKNAITAFNEKHGEALKLVKEDLHIYNDGFWGKLIDRHYVEV